MTGQVELKPQIAALRVKPEHIEQARRAFGPDVIYVAPVAIEATGTNAIPQWSVAPRVQEPYV